MKDSPLPSPSWSESLEPQAQTTPALSSARLWSLPATIALIGGELCWLTWANSGVFLTGTRTSRAPLARSLPI
jgi:hypothetical protein